MTIIVSLQWDCYREERKRRGQGRGGGVGEREGGREGTTGVGGERGRRRRREGETGEWISSPTLQVAKGPKAFGVNLSRSLNTDLWIFNFISKPMGKMGDCRRDSFHLLI